MTRYKILLAGIALLSVTAAFAQAAITPQQLEQFKRLPAAQQELLARQYGFDLSLLRQSGTNQSAWDVMDSSDAQIKERRQLEADNVQIDEKELDGTAADQTKQRKPFGYNLFAGTPTTFQQPAYVPVPSDYRVGPGDSVVVNLFGKESEQYEITIDREGQLLLPKLPPLSVTGLSFNELKQLLQQEVAQRMVGMQAAVSMGKLRSIQIYVAGEAYKPGSYTVSSLTTAMQALFVSGGVTDIASLRAIEVKRAGRTISTLDLYDFLIRGDAQADVLLQSGDIVFVPARKTLVEINGEVLRPGLYELSKERSVAAVIALAGGALPSSYVDSVQITRFRQGQRQVETIALQQQQQFSIENGDVIRLLPIAEHVTNSVRLMGAVARPGYYAWTPDSKITDVLRSHESSLLPVADLNYGLVVREREQGRYIEVMQFNLSLALRNDAAHNLSLSKNDTLVVFSRYRGQAAEEAHSFKRSSTDAEALASASREQLLAPILSRLRSQMTETAYLPIVNVVGEVRFPGAYPLPQGATAEDLIMAAGGLRESAYLERAEITRIETKADTSTTRYIPIDIRDASKAGRQTELRGRDTLNILTIPEWQNTVEVTLEGEVRFPGSYTVRRGETLTALLQRAGGLTEHAFANGAIFTRSELQQLESQRMQQLAQDLRREVSSRMISGSSSTVSYNELNQLLSDLTNVTPVGRLVIDLPYILSGSMGADVQLKDGDRLVIPSQRNTVNVIGEVQLASAHIYDGSLSVQDYLRRAGGLRKKADDERIFIVKANGGVEMMANTSWFGFGNQQRLEPGDTIVVPLDTEFKDNMTLWRDATQILYQTGVAIAAIATL
jgi:polysaccharide export outer membrane protein